MKSPDGWKADGVTGPSVSIAARRYALALLFCAYVLNYIDRQVVAILQDPIKVDLGLSDTQLGMITGLSFALFYAVLGLPIARIADRRSRKGIIAVSVALWSVMTALCGLANSFVTLLLCRVGVGIGEAGLTPSAHSLISDYYEPRRRASAIAIYSAAGTVGLMIGFLGGGWLNAFFGWRNAILLVGLPGIVLALIMVISLPEPLRGRFENFEEQPAAHSDDEGRAGFLHLARNPAFICLALGCGFHTFVTYGQGNWIAPYLGRVHGMSSGEIGIWLAFLSIGPALAGIVLTGYFADWLSRKRPYARLETVMGSMILIIPFEIASYLFHDTRLALVAFAGSFFFGGAYLAPSIAAAQSMLPPRLRATASAVIMLGVNLIGLGLGPLVAGFLSDHWALAAGGADSLRQAMLAIIPSEGLAIVLLACALVHQRRLARAEGRGTLGSALFDKQEGAV
ncbi:MAG TPA: MFS transporter [Sphingobium sp.]|uniref:spinster family MFS transporter n=1 Tax=Sphingobium sp. TaxID=1912891 RepID=UPI002ED61EBF